MIALSGLEKFSHLEDQIYRTIELTKTLRLEKESLEKELSNMRRNRGSVPREQERLEMQVEALLAERDIIRMKVEAMLDAVAVLDPELAETQMTTGIAEMPGKKSVETSAPPIIRVEIYNQTYNIRSDGDSAIPHQACRFCR